MRKSKSKSIHIPQTSSWVTWTPGKRGQMHITAALPLHDDSHPRLDYPRLRRELKKGTTNRSGGYVPIELKFPRSSFDLTMKVAAYFQEAHPLKEEAVIRDNLPKHTRTVIGCTPQEVLSDWAHAIVETLHCFGLHCAGEQARPTMKARWMADSLPDTKDSQYRQSNQSINCAFAGVPFRIVLRRSGLRQLGELCSTPEGKRDLAFAVRWHLLPSILADWGLSGLPRGRHLVQAQFLQRTAAVAIEMARTLVDQAAGGDTGLRKELTKVIGSHIRLSSARQRNHVVLELADRTLQPAWSKHKISSPLQLDLDPDKACKHICPPHRRTALRDMLTQLTPRQREMFTARWFSRLLGLEGQTATDFKLL